MLYIKRTESACRYKHKTNSWSILGDFLKILYPILHNLIKFDAQSARKIHVLASYHHVDDQVRCRIQFTNESNEVPVEA